MLSLINKLGIPEKDVTIVFINNLRSAVDSPVSDGDRSACSRPWEAADLPAPRREAIQQRADSAPLPWAGPDRSSPSVQWHNLPRNTPSPDTAIEAAALEAGVFPARYLRNMQSIPARDQIRLLNGSIAQIGLGGLGGTLLDLFLRAGVGRIRAADGDRFEESNLNRQALADLKTLSSSKADAARGKADAVNPSVDLEVRDAFLDPDAFPGFVRGCNLAVDALGGLTSRLALHEATAAEDIPLVTGALAGWTGYVAVVCPERPAPPRSWAMTTVPRSNSAARPRP